MIRHERQATATSPNASHIPPVRTYMLSVASPSNYRCGMTDGLSLETKLRLLGHLCPPHSVNGSHRSRELICSTAIVRSLEWCVEELLRRGFQMIGSWKKGGRLKTIGSPGTRDWSEESPSSGKGFDGLVRVAFIHSSLGVTSSMAVTRTGRTHLERKP
jgi:hypothetical protein